MVPVTVRTAASKDMNKTRSNSAPSSFSIRRWSSVDKEEHGNIHLPRSALTSKSISTKFRFSQHFVIQLWSSLFLSIMILQGTSPAVAYSPRQNGVPDTKSCCRSKGVSDYCMEKMCDTSRPPDEFEAFEVSNDCTNYLSSIATCLSDGRNHSGCCRARADRPGTDDLLCMHLCDGSPYYFNASMTEEYKGYVSCLTFNAQSIFNCLDRGYKMSPGPPNRLEIIRVESSKVKLKWALPTILPNKVTGYSVFYADIWEPSRRYVGWTPAFKRVDTRGDSRSYELDGLAPDTKYKVYVVARGQSEDAISLPSDSVELVTEGVASRVETYKPKVESPIGLPATLICMVYTQGGGERQNVRVNWYFGRNSANFDSTPLPGQLKYQQVKRAMSEPMTDQISSSEAVTRTTYMAALTVNRVNHGDLGFYKCSIRTPFGDTPSAVVELAKSAPPRMPHQPPNVTDCCVNEKVPNICLSSCQNNPDEPMPANSIGSPKCSAAFPRILRCALGTGEQQRDRGPCCLRSGVPLSCLFLCDTTRPMDSSNRVLFPCIQYTEQLLRCMIESKMYLPSPPVDLRIKEVTGNSLTLEWSQDRFGSVEPVDVLKYYVYYKKQTDPNWTSISTESTNVKLTNLLRNVRYVVQVVSANAAGTSDASRPITFTNGDRLRDQIALGSNSRRRKSRTNVRHHHQHLHNQQTARQQAIALMTEQDSSN